MGSRKLQKVALICEALLRLNFPGYIRSILCHIKRTQNLISEPAARFASFCKGFAHWYLFHDRQLWLNHSGYPAAHTNSEKEALATEVSVGVTPPLGTALIQIDRQIFLREILLARSVEILKVMSAYESSVLKSSKLVQFWTVYKNWQRVFSTCQYECDKLPLFTSVTYRHRVFSTCQYECDKLPLFTSVTYRHRVFSTCQYECDKLPLFTSVTYRQREFSTCQYECDKLLLFTSVTYRQREFSTCQYECDKLLLFTSVTYRQIEFSTCQYECDKLPLFTSVTYRQREFSTCQYECDKLPLFTSVTYRQREFSTCQYECDKLPLFTSVTYRQRGVFDVSVWVW